MKTIPVPMSFFVFNYWKFKNLPHRIGLTKQMVSRLFFYCCLYLLVQLISYSSLHATETELTSTTSCESICKIIDDLFDNVETFSDYAQSKADQILLLSQNKNCDCLADAYTLLGSINYNLNEHKKSKQYLSESQKLIDGKLENSKTAVRLNLVLGLSSIDEKNLKSAEFYFKMASSISQKIKYPIGTLQANLNLGLSYINDDRLEEAKIIFYESENIVRDMGNDKLGAYVYQNLARIFIAEKNYDEAIVNTQIAFDMWDAIDFKKGMFFCNSNFAIIYEQLKDSTQWVNYLTKLINYTGEEKTYIRHYPYMKLGNYHFANNNYEDSKKMYELALKQSNTIAEEELIAITSNLYELYSRDNDLESIKKINDEVLKIYSYQSDIYTAEASKWQSTAVEKLEENKSLLFDKKLRNILLILLFLAFNGALFYFQRYRYRQKIENERKLTTIRNKISRDLHDDVGTILAGVSSQAQLLELYASKGENKESHDNIINSANKIVDGSKTAMDNMRDTVWAMDTRSDKLISLKLKMLDFLRYTLEPLDIEYNCQFDLHDEEGQLLPTVRQAAYLIFKESIANIGKHSNTKKVDILMSSSKDNIIVSVQDYGQKKDNLISAGQGLKNMSFRAKNLNGTYSFDYKNNGYQTSFSLPMG